MPQVLGRPAYQASERLRRKFAAERMQAGSRSMAYQAIFMVQTAQDRRGDRLRVFGKVMTGEWVAHYNRGTPARARTG
jgi:hypothetical protein